MKCVQSTFDEIYDTWHDKLWPDRVSKIEPMSSLYWQLPNTIIKDKTIFDKYTPTFWTIKSGDNIVGVNSGFRTGEKIYRSRGLYVDEEYRNKGLSQILLRQAILQGREKNVIGYGVCLVRQLFQFINELDLKNGENGWKKE